ncbi:uncharacterized protein [Primulina huaijiensis]|uniref:uncharacterized protein n=1 Tax=Primulina huaijiensis TaxID=1492673 RepID=UPI003CC74117
MLRLKIIQILRMASSREFSQTKSVPCTLLVLNPSQVAGSCMMMTSYFLETCIKKQAISFVSGGICDELVDPSIASQKSIFAVGMICCEEEGRLKEKPVLLQSSVFVLICRSYTSSLFSQDRLWVGVEGLNPSGHCLIASKLIDYVPLSVDICEDHTYKRQAIDQNLQMTNFSLDVPELSLIVAAGPFTTNDNLFFEPLIELLAYACRKQPQFLVLVGPFVDSDHPGLKKGLVNCTFHEMFQVEIFGKVSQVTRGML